MGMSSMTDAFFVYGDITICVDARRTRYCCTQLINVPLDDMTRDMCQTTIDSIDRGQTYIPENVRAVVEQKYKDIILGMRIRGVRK